MNELNFPSGYQKESSEDYLFSNQVTLKSMIPTPAMDMDTDSTDLARHKDGQRNELIYRNVGSYVNNAMTVDEILKAADLQWEVAKLPTFFRDDRGNFCPHDKYYGIVRTDTNQVLSSANLASAGWTIYQNKSVIEQFCKFCAEADIELERVGSLQNGQIIFAVAKVNSSFSLVDNDIVSGKLILTNSHKPGEGVKVNLMALRRICTNALVAPVRTNGVVIRHNSNLKELVPQVLATAKQNFRTVEKDFSLMSQTPMTKEVAMAILIETFGKPELELEEQPKVVRHCLQTFVNKTDKGGELLSSFETAFGLLNAVTNYYNHVKTSDVGSTQINSLWLGSKQKQQQKIYQQIVSVCSR